MTAAERAVYIVAGLGLAATSLRPRPNTFLSALALLGGSFLAWRGYLGHCPVKAALIGSASLARQN
nr:YgaP-like transmembrane domain [Microvirga terricola]